MVRTRFLEQKNSFENKIFSGFVNEIGLESEQEYTFKNCVFESSFILEDLTIINKLSFHNCTFRQYSKIKSCNLRVLEFSECVFETEFNLQSNESLILDINVLSGPKLFINGIYQNLNIRECILDELKLKDINTIYTPFDSALEFKNNIIEKVDFASTSTYSNIILTNGDYKEFYFNGEFNNPIAFKGNNLIIEYLLFESSTFKARIDFDEGFFEYVNFYRSNFQGLIWIYDFDLIQNIRTKEIEIKNLSLHSNSFEKSVTVKISKLSKLLISDNNFKQIFNFTNSLDNSENERTDISIDGSNLGSLVFEKVNADLDNRSINFGNIYFKDVKFRHLILIDFQNNGVISFSNIKIAELFVIQNSNVGKAEFINTDFKNFEEIIIANSNISSMIFSEFPYKITSFTKNPRIGYGIKNKKDNNANLRSVYNQLKKVAITMGDIDTGNKYQSLEYKHLFRQKGFLNIDKILLGLNYLSNDNGYSWFRGIIFTMTIFVLSFYSFTFFSGDSNTFSNFIIYMTSFPKLIIKDSDSINWKLELVKWVSRIFIGYGLYQTIAAFRKYGKGAKY